MSKKKIVFGNEKYEFGRQLLGVQKINLVDTKSVFDRQLLMSNKTRFW
jgi:hypothetical protein